MAWSISAQRQKAQFDKKGGRVVHVLWKALQVKACHTLSLYFGSFGLEAAI